MITLENCNCKVDHVLTRDETVPTLRKIYLMTRCQPVDLLESEDGVWKEAPFQDFESGGSYGHFEDSLNYSF